MMYPNEIFDAANEYRQRLTNTIRSICKSGWMRYLPNGFNGHPTLAYIHHGGDAHAGELIQWVRTHEHYRENIHMVVAIDPFNRCIQVRSLDSSIPSHTFAQQFGGGGHATAAGARDIPSMAFVEFIMKPYYLGEPMEIDY